MIAGAVGHLWRCSADGQVQEEVPHPYVVVVVAGKLGTEQCFEHGGGDRRVEEGFCPGACSGGS